MRVSGYEYLHNSVPDFNTSEKIDAQLNITTKSFESFTSGNFPGTEFSTEDEPAGNTVQEGNSILNQYRFFVRSNHYEGSEGVVRRIFK